MADDAAKDEQAVAASESGAKIESSPEPPLPKRSVWPWLVLLVALALGGGYAGWRVYTAPVPTRVLVAIAVDGHWWQGSKAAAALADALAQKLEKLGFDPVRAGDPAVVAALEHASSPVEAARKLKAAFVIGGVIDATVVELPVPQKLIEAGLEGQLEVRDVESGELARAPLAGFSNGHERDAAVTAAAQWLADAVLDTAVPAMMDGERLKAIVGGRDPKLVDKLAPANTYCTIRNSKKAEVDQAYAKLEAARLGEEQGGGLAFVSDARADDRLIAVGDKGVLVATAAVDAVYHHAQVDVTQELQLETLEWRAAGGPAAPSTRAALLWRGFNAFTYPTASADGATVALIEDIYGYARSVTIAAGGKLARVRVEPDLRLSEPKLAPDGKKIALVERECVGCPPSIVVLDLSDANARELFRLDRGDYLTFSGFSWLDAAHLMATFVPKDGGTYRVSGDPRPTLWAFDVAARRGEALFSAGADDSALGTPVASADGKRVAMAVTGVRGSEIAVVAVAEKKASRWAAGRGAAGLAWSRDGARVALEYFAEGTRYEEIAVIDAASGKLTRLTHNDSPDRFPQWAPDGGRVYFEAKNADPVFGRRRAVSRVAWLPAPK